MTYLKKGFLFPTVTAVTMLESVRREFVKIVVVATRATRFDDIPQLWQMITNLWQYI